MIWNAKISLNFHQIYMANSNAYCRHSNVNAIKYSPSIWQFDKFQIHLIGIPFLWNYVVERHSSTMLFWPLVSSRWPGIRCHTSDQLTMVDYSIECPQIMAALQLSKLNVWLAPIANAGDSQNNNAHFNKSNQMLYYHFVEMYMWG